MYADLRGTKKSRCLFNLVAVILMLAIITLTTGAAFDKQLKKITIIHKDAFSGNSLSESYITKASTVSEVFAENGIILYDDEILNVSPNSKIFGGEKIIINKIKNVYILFHGEGKTVSVTQNTVGEALTEAGFAVVPSDTVTPSLDSEIQNNMLISIDKLIKKRIIISEELPFEEVIRYDDSIPEGTTEVLSEGINGKRNAVYDIIYENGIEKHRELIYETFLSPPVDREIIVGTKKVDNYIDGQKYSKKIQVTATAYTATGNLTATGRVAEVGVIAVDPRVIPLNSKLYVVAADGSSWCYGTCVAGDTGGKIKGNRIDLYYDTKSECINFGKRPAVVYVLD